jgi:release factor glutamine methyltransferase
MKLFEVLREAAITLRTSSLRGGRRPTRQSFGSGRNIKKCLSNSPKIASLPAAPRNDSVLDARLLLQHLLGMSHEELIINDHMVLNSQKLEEYQKLLERRANQEPIAYITASKEFFSRDFYVNPHILIPRSDTEILVEEALLFLRKRPIDAKILDLGTGSGCIIISLLCELPSAQGFGVDISPNALSVARSNAEKYGLQDRLMLLESNWFVNISPQKFDLIISNPPYIAEGDNMVSLETSRYEPKISLYADENGLYAYKIIASGAREYLNADGSIIVEIGINQEKDVIEIFEGQGFECKKMAKDLSGIIRCLVF